jgi:hypothetical protein
MDRVLVVHDYGYWLAVVAASVLLACALCYTVRGVWHFYHYVRFFKFLEETIENGEEHFGAKQH